MDFKLVSKNNLGAVATLFLVILLSQARFFDFLVGTALGRAIIILFILGISYTNKILGVVAVLFIIISFNNSNIGYLEGLTTNTPNANTNASAPNTNANANTNAATTNTNAATTNANATNANATTTTTNTTTTTKAPNDKLNEKKSESKGIEGYNITEREGMMLRGKCSSEIPVYSNARNQGDDVEPSDKTVFAGNYSSI
jgi:hypothetical protein